MIETIDDLYAHCDLVQDNVNRAFASSRDFLHLTLAIDEMEMVIRAAIAGDAPDASTWGALRANEFLQIVQDVTSWALTNFEAFKARPAAEELPRGISGTGSPYFRKAPRLQPPYDSDATVRTLSSVNDPALRCAALWSGASWNLYFYRANETTERKVLSWKAKSLVLNDKRHGDLAATLAHWSCGLECSP